ncbi:MAG: serine/threonine protein phosphatase [Candidatus Hecatellales archaeon]|nr:MAG: serine/threonine protein phosphatase [Candidatus Hecatellales archaeon]
MGVVEEIVEKAKTVQPSEFIGLIENVCLRLDKEKEVKSLENYKVEEGLVDLKAKGKIVVVGDIHGDLESLIYILKNSNFLDAVRRGEKPIILFLGDYGDRGFLSPEVYYIVFWLKANHPENVILLRGNHEGPSDLIAVPHDLPYHLKRKFGGNWEKIYEKFLVFFDKLPHSAILKGKYLFLHGGIPSEAKNLQDLSYAAKHHPAKRLLEEILWSDPEEDIKGVYPSPRGAGKLFGEDVTKSFLGKIGVKTLIRGHEPCYEGIKVNHNGAVLTVFSRKGEPYFNPYAAYLEIDSQTEALNGYQLKTKAKIF